MAAEGLWEVPLKKGTCLLGCRFTALTFMLGPAPAVRPPGGLFGRDVAFPGCGLDAEDF